MNIANLLSVVARLAIGLRTVAILTVLFLSLVTEATGQLEGIEMITRDEVATAIENGRGDLDEEGVNVGAGRFSATGFRIQLDGPRNLIAKRAAEWHSKYLSITPDSIPSEMWAKALTLVAMPLEDVRSRSNGRPVVTNAPSHVVLRVEIGGSERVIQPLSVEPFEVSVRGEEKDLPDDLLSGGIRALFSLAEIPPGGFDILVISPDKEYEHDVDDDEWERVR